MELPILVFIGICVFVLMYLFPKPKKKEPSKADKSEKALRDFLK
jgi:hypothetical protein